MTFDLTRSVPIARGLASGGGPLPQRTLHAGGQDGPSFAETLEGYIKEVGSVGKAADIKVEELLAGGTSDPHQVMLAVEEANMALEMLIEVRNKLLEAYQELMRTSL